MAKPNRDDVDDLFERRPATRPVALALGRAVLLLVVGLLVVAVAGRLVDVPAAAFALPVAVAALYGYAGYRKGQRLDAD